MQKNVEARLDGRADKLWGVVITLIGRIPESERPAFWKEVEELVGLKND